MLGVKATGSSHGGLGNWPILGISAGTLAERRRACERLASGDGLTGGGTSEIGVLRIC
jgi:alkylation response protein AidB-like acyl-CoA dehydrogenase